MQSYFYIFEFKFSWDLRLPCATIKMMHKWLQMLLAIDTCFLWTWGAYEHSLDLSVVKIVKVLDFTVEI